MNFKTRKFNNKKKERILFISSFCVFSLQKKIKTKSRNSINFEIMLIVIFLELYHQHHHLLLLFSS